MSITTEVGDSPGDRGLTRERELPAHLGHRPAHGGRIAKGDETGRDNGQE